MNEAFKQWRRPLIELLPNTHKRFAVIALLCAINLVLIIWIANNIQQIKESRQENSHLQHSQKKEKDELDTENNRQSAREEVIKKRLANRDDLNGLILSLESIALAHGVTLSDVNQNYVEASRDKLPHSVIQYTVQGSYANVLQFVAESLNKHDALVLQRLSFRRADPLVSNLQIDLEWAYYYP